MKSYCQIQTSAPLMNSIKNILQFVKVNIQTLIGNIKDIICINNDVYIAVYSIKDIQYINHKEYKGKNTTLGYPVKK